jgi:hypothetical protein
MISLARGCQSPDPLELPGYSLQIRDCQVLPEATRRHGRIRVLKALTGSLTECGGIAKSDSLLRCKDSPQE